MFEKCDVSVVIGFRNWGIDRLELSVRSILESFGELRGEVIVSDYGSDNHLDTKSRMEALGAKFVFTETDGPWSRSRALNAGFAISKGNILISTDADMLFSPGAIEIIAETIIHDTSVCLLLQCRDLPEKWSDAEVLSVGFMWDSFESDSRLRPRWGMGGMMAVPRIVFERIRGLDERMHTYGGEDIDFATRAKRAGQRLHWIEDGRVRMYHMWHPPTKTEVARTQGAVEAIEYNKEIVYNDETFVRNAKAWKYPLKGAAPLVSVAISTFNRSTYLKQSIQSILVQTMQDFEIVVVDDGSTDDTREIVSEFSDARIKYIFQENRGIAAARNRALDHSSGFYTAVHDDDDLMTPWRLERHFQNIPVGSHGSFGSFVNFDNVTGELHLFASKVLNEGTISETGGAPGHGTWMVETDILRRLRYDESLSSGVDNNMALRMVRSGVRLVHSGEIMMMRRMHTGQITVIDEGNQRTSANQTRHLFAHNMTKWGKDKLAAERGAADYVPIRNGKNLDMLLPYLPDHLIRRRIQISGPTPENFTGTFLTVAEINESGETIHTYGDIRDASMSDVLLCASSGLSFAMSAVLKSEANPKHKDPDFDMRSLHKAVDIIHIAAREAAKLYTSSSPVPIVLVIVSLGAESTVLLRDHKYDIFRRSTFRSQSLEREYMFLRVKDVEEGLRAQHELGLGALEIIGSKLPYDSSLLSNVGMEPKEGSL